MCFFKIDNRVYASFLRPATQPIARVTLAALMVITNQPPSLAQWPIMAGMTLAQQGVGSVQPALAYKLGPGDRIRMDILEVPDFSAEYDVLSDGTVSLPLIGTISVQGLTFNQATNLITRAYLRFLKNPVISLTLITPRPIRVTVSGEVNRPGAYSIPLTAGVGLRPGVQYATVTQAIERAGGITQAADLRRVQIRRPQRVGQTPTFNIDLRQLLQVSDSSQDIILQDGDEIFIPTAASLNLAEARQLATASFATPADQPRTVAVIGEVNRPGAYVLVGGSTRSELRPGGLPTVSAAIQQAGGITSLADIRNIQIRRPTSTGQDQLIDINLWQLLQAGDFSQDTIVQDGDTIFIPTATDVNPAEAGQIATARFSPDSINVYVAGEVRLPGAVQVPPNSSLNQALLAKGGFGPDNPRARRNAVELIRVHPNGTVSRRTIKLDFSQSVNEQTNPLLRNNDIIVINRTNLATFVDTIAPALGPVEIFQGGFTILSILRQLLN